MPTSNQVTKKYKSAPLLPKEKNALAKYVAKYPSLSQAADEIGIPRSTLERTMLYGSASPTNTEIIRKALAA